MFFQFQDDYEWLQDMGDTEDLVGGDDQGSGKDVDLNELKHFINKLGFEKLKSQAQTR